MQILIICLQPDATMSAPAAWESVFFATPTLLWMTSSGLYNLKYQYLVKSTCEVSRENSDDLA